jgi:hypothetical protein
VGGGGCQFQPTDHPDQASENARKRFKNSAVIMIMAYFHHDEATIVEEPYSDDDGVKPKMKPNTNTTKEKKRYHVR